MQAWSANAANNVYFETGAWGGYMNMRLVTWKGIAMSGTCSVDCHNGWDYDGPCVINCHNGWNAAYSFHPGGINALACDGSVRFVKESVTALGLPCIRNESPGRDHQRRLPLRWEMSAFIVPTSSLRGIA